MSNLQSLKRRIKSIDNSSKVIKAMRMVASNKLKKAKLRYEKYRLTKDINNKLFYRVLAQSDINSLGSNHSKLFDKVNFPKRRLFLIIGSDRGLCGGFNSRLFKLVSSDINKIRAAKEDLALITIGNKAKNYFNFSNKNILLKSYNNSFNFELDNSMLLEELILNQIQTNNIDECRVYYNNSKSLVSVIPSYKVIFPISKDFSMSSESDLMLEGQNLLESLLKDFIISEFYNLLLISRVSEESSRMLAMENASNNANTVRDELNIEYNSKRQSSITKEICEIISGSEAT